MATITDLNGNKITELDLTTYGLGDDSALRGVAAHQKDLVRAVVWRPVDGGNPPLSPCGVGILHPEKGRAGHAENGDGTCYAAP